MDLLRERTIWIVDAHGYGKRFVVRADEKLTAFLELEAAIRACGEAIVLDEQVRFLQNSPSAKKNLNLGCGLRKPSLGISSPLSDLASCRVNHREKERKYLINPMIQSKDCLKNQNIQFKATAGLVIPLLLACFAAVFISPLTPAIAADQVPFSASFGTEFTS
jgi:hypothetical protein